MLWATVGSAQDGRGPAFPATPHPASPTVEGCWPPGGPPPPPRLWLFQPPVVVGLLLGWLSHPPPPPPATLLSWTAVGSAGGPLWRDALRWEPGPTALSALLPPGGRESLAVSWCGWALGKGDSHDPGMRSLLRLE